MSKTAASLLFALWLVSPVFGQDAAAGSQLTVNSQKDLTDLFLEKAAENAATIIVAAIGSLFAFYWNSLRRRFKTIRWSWPKEQSVHAVTTILLGLSSTGKTSIISQMFGYFRGMAGAPNPKRPTEKLNVYSLIHENRTPEAARVYRIDVADYRGSDVGQLTTGWHELVKQARLPTAKALILVVDLFDTSGKLDDTRPRQQIEKKRIDQHLHEWTDTTLKAITGVTGRDFNLVAIFINKADLLDTLTLPQLNSDNDPALLEIFKRFEPIIKALGEATSSEVQVFIGSAKQGIAVNELLASLKSACDT